MVKIKVHEILVWLLFLLCAPVILFILFIIDGLRGEKHAKYINLVGSTYLIVYGFFFYIVYWLEGFPKEHLVLYSVPGLGEVYGILIDPFSVAFSSIISIVAGAVMIYSTDYMTPSNNYHPVISGKAKFYAWMYLFISSVLLFVCSSSLIQLLINFELMSLACWGLISYYGSPEATRSSYKMLIITHLGAYAGLGTAIAYLILNTSNTSLLVLGRLNDWGKILIITTAMWAAITKSSQFPTYSWLPDAMVAPTPTSALLHGATMIEMGPYLMARILYYAGNLPRSTIYVILVPVTITLLIATSMYPLLKDGKRLLAYSTIAEASIMYFTVSTMIYNKILGLELFLLYFTIHAFLKSSGFLLMGIAGYIKGTHDLDEIIGLIGSSPFLYNALIAVLFGLSGIPVFSIAKIYVLVRMGSVLSDPVSITAYILVLAESLVFLIISMKWVGKAREARSIFNDSLPRRMCFSIALLLFCLYFYQLYFFTTMMPSVGGGL